MSVTLKNDLLANVFFQKLLNISNGKIKCQENTELIKSPEYVCNIVDSIIVLIKKVFLNIHDNYGNHQWLCERAIMAPKNTHIDQTNFTIHERTPDELISFKLTDIVTNANYILNFPIEFLNLLDLPGFPPYNLYFKIGSRIIGFET